MVVNDLLIIAIIIINIILGIFILFNNRKKRANIFFGAIVFCFAIWSFSFYMRNKVSTPDDIFFWVKISNGIMSFIPILFFYFSLTFSHTKITLNKIIKFLLILLPLFFVITGIFNLVAKGVEENSGQFRAIPGKIFITFSLYFVFFCILSFYNLVSSYRKSEGIYKLQIKYFFVGSFFTTLITIVANLILPGLGIPNLSKLGPSSTVIIVLFTAYAITRYRLMDIRLVVVRSIAFATLILLITGVYAGLSIIIGSMLERFIGTSSQIVVGLVVALLIAIGYSPIKRGIENITNKFLFKKTYNPDDLISQVNDISTSILDLNNMLASISKALTDALHAGKISFALLNKKGRLELSYERGFGKKIYDFTRGKEAILPIYFKDSKQIYVIEELKTAYEQGEYTPKNIKLMYALYEMDIALVVPLFTKEKLIGLIVLGNKKSGDLYNKQDLHVLDIISGQAAVGIENAILYEEQRQFGIRLEKTVAERTSQLRVANVKLKELDSAKSEFISIASHQLRTPLTVIKGYISMILEGSFGKTSKVVKDCLNKVYLSNERLIGLVEDLLNISRIESGKQEYNFQPLDLVFACQSVYEELQQKAAMKKIKLDFEKPKVKIAQVVADADKLHEVMMNFTDNAIKYTPSGFVKIKIEQKDDNIIFSVRDSGIGMSKEDMSHLFQKFSRAKGSSLVHTEGTGLGLYVAKMIVESHMGGIWAKSEGRGKGSVFYFSIPVLGKGRSIGILTQERIKSLDVRGEQPKDNPLIIRTPEKSVDPIKAQRSI
ncbi:hypothetical protein C4569_03055 [Candidatus Parcubacteria bacterium]|nr:MAG: hypothetical protein C4569_03055 [Candidatus Parcubacteria bacterium]